MPKVNLRGKEENEQSEVVHEMEVSAFEIKTLLNPNMLIGQTQLPLHLEEKSSEGQSSEEKNLSQWSQAITTSSTSLPLPGSQLLVLETR